MKLEGIHHITAITGDAPGNVDFYARVLRLAHGQEVGQPGRPDRLRRRRERRAARRGHGPPRCLGDPPRGGGAAARARRRRGRPADAGHRPPLLRSIYFREPSGVLFELATIGPGFTADEPLETLGEGLSLPPDYERLRESLAEVLTPLSDTRPWRRAGREAPAASEG